MELSTIQRLAALNRDFYATHAGDFADSRPRLAPGVQRVLGLLRAQAAGQSARPLRVLELGCGDGKVARALPGANYVGVDHSAAMIEIAARLTAASAPPAGSANAGQPPTAARFYASDLTDPAWPVALPAGPYDWVLAFSVFHHLPGRALRRQVLHQAAALLRAGGHAAMSNWQFARSERLLTRVRPWELAGIDPAELEPGDYLLSWERKGRTGLRYVHLLDQAEARELAHEAGLRVVEIFQSDGVSGDLSEYVVMQHAI
jgi:tRNA (uracil-5-)-methyltransferase TRM9